MRRVSEAIKDIIEHNELLQTGLQHRLFNLSQLAQYIRPQVEAWTMKEVQPTAIVMSLSRLQRSFSARKTPKAEKILLENITVRSSLFAVTYNKVAGLHRQISALHRKLEKLESYFTIAEGLNEITLILERDREELLSGVIEQKPIYQQKQVASLSVKIHPRYLNMPGFFYVLFQQLFLQNINIIEIGSTATELIFYLNEKDVQLAFDTLYRRFKSR